MNKKLSGVALYNCEQSSRNYANMSEEKGITEALRMARLMVSVAYREAADQIRWEIGLDAKCPG